MRISTVQLNASALNGIQDQQAKASDMELRIATGKKILTPADDPAGAARSLNLSLGLDQIDQYQKNINLSRARLATEEDSLSNINEVLARVRELSIYANNATQGPASREDIASEIRQRLDEVINFSNTKDGNSEFLFAGFRSQTQPFSLNAGVVDYNGDQGQRFLQISTSRQIAVGDPGSDVFMAIKNGNGDFVTGPNAANRGTGVVSVGAVVDQTAYAAISANSYEIVIADATAATNAVSFNDVNANDALEYALTINGTSIPIPVAGGGAGANTPNFTEGEAAPSLVELRDAINTQVGTTGVRAYVDGTTLHLANTIAGAGAIQIGETLVNASDATDSLTGLFGGTMTGGTPSHTTTITGAGGNYLLIDGANVVQTSGTYADGGAIAFSGMQTDIKGDPVNGDRFTLIPATNQSMFQTVQNIIAALTATGPSAVDTAEVQNSIGRSIRELDSAMDNVSRVRAKVGSRLVAIDSQETANEAFHLSSETNLSQIQDLDYAAATSDLNLYLVGLQAAQQGFVKLQGLSLFNYI